MVMHFKMHPKTVQKWFLVFFLLTFQVSTVQCYASVMRIRCDSVLATTTSGIMDGVNLDSSRSISILRDDKPLKSGDLYYAGEQLTVMFDSNDLNTEGWIYDVKGGGTFEGSPTKLGCSNTRSQDKSPILNLPDGSGLVTVEVGWAKDFGIVSLTEKFVLNPAPVTASSPPSSIRLSKVPTSAPTQEM